MFSLPLPPSRVCGGGGGGGQGLMSGIVLYSSSPHHLNQGPALSLKLVKWIRLAG